MLTGELEFNAEKQLPDSKKSVWMSEVRSGESEPRGIPFQALF